MNLSSQISLCNLKQKWTKRRRPEVIPHSFKIINFAYVYSGKLYFSVNPFINRKLAYGGGSASIDIKKFKQGEWIMLGTAWDKEYYRYFVIYAQQYLPVAEPQVLRPAEYAVF